MFTISTQSSLLPSGFYLYVTRDKAAELKKKIRLAAEAQLRDLQAAEKIVFFLKHQQSPLLKTRRLTLLF
jgi:hypothetical protein